MKKTPQIFVVEDDPPMNALLCTFLESKGFNQVHAFFSVEEMLARVHRKDPIIIIQDYELPGMNGLDSIRSVKPKYPNVEYIFLSGQHSIDVAIEAIKSGAFDYLVKDSFAKENVLIKIRNLLRVKQLERRHKRMLFFLAGSMVLLLFTALALIYTLFR